MATTPRELTVPAAAHVLAQSTDGILCFDGSLRYTFWNKAMERLSGLSSARAIGRSALDVFPELSKTGDDAHYHRALAGEEISAVRRRLSIPETGREGIFDGSFGPLRDESGQIHGGIAIFRDVTERHRADELLRETEARFRTMADVAPVMLWMSDTDGLCSFFNQTWLEFTGRTLEEEWGVGWAELVHFEDFQACMDTYVAAFNNRRVFEMEYRLQRHDGEYRWILDRGTPRYTPNGLFAGYIGSCIDITERRTLEAELRTAIRARDEFLSIASHELRTPMTSMQLQVDSLTRQIELRGEEALHSGRLERGATAVREQTERLATLVDALLDVSRINTGRLGFEYTHFDLVELVSAIVERWTAIANRSLSREQEGKADAVRVTSAPARLLGLWDRLRVEQVLNNLLSNAVKFGGGMPVELRVAASDDSAVVEVSDHGIGVAPAEQARIFGRFERVESNGYSRGLGLGLWISREIVEGLGGSILLESEPNQGSTFTVRLPRMPQTAARTGNSLG